MPRASWRPVRLVVWLEALKCGKEAWGLKSPNFVPATQMLRALAMYRAAACPGHEPCALTIRSSRRCLLSQLAVACRYPDFAKLCSSPLFQAHGRRRSNCRHRRNDPVERSGVPLVPDELSRRSVLCCPMLLYEVKFNGCVSGDVCFACVLLRANRKRGACPK